jgi:polysaccharide export outer membrane protein
MPVTPKRKFCRFLQGFACLAILSGHAENVNAQQLASGGFAPWMEEDPKEHKAREILDEPLDPKPLTLADLEKITGVNKYALSDAQDLTPVEAMYTDRTGRRLELFGYDLFDQKSEISNKLPAGVVQDDYILSSGDKIEIVYRGQDNIRKIYEINSQGMLVPDSLTPINAAGRTIGDVRKTLEEETLRLHNTQIYVTLTAARQISVLVIGDITKPGRQTLSSFHSVLDVLQQAGGVKKSGSLRRIKLVRNGTSKIIDLYSVMMQAGSAADTKLQDGDRIIIPPIGVTVAVTGAVKRPGIYEIKKGETINALEMLGLAGGVIAPGSNRFMRLALTSDGRETVDDLDDPTKKLFGDGSILDVAQAKEKRSRNVTLSGDTRDPGEHALKKAKTLSELMRDGKSLKDSVYPLIGVIERHDHDSLTKTFVEFSPRQVLRKEFDTSLSEGDVVHLFSMEQIRSLGGKISSEPLLQQASYSAEEKKDLIEDAYIVSFLQERAAFVRGAVRQPGAYPVSKDTSLDSLIAVAGGTTIEANTDNIEVTSRLIPANETGEAMTPTRINVNLSNAEPSTILIAPGDTVRVNQKFNRVEEQSITLVGEVKNPGKYDLLPGDTMLSLINRAGGLNDIAYPDGVIFSRAAERKQEEARYKAQARDLEMKLATALQQEGKDKKPDMAQVSATQAIITQLQDAKAVGRITVEADPGVLTSDPEQDILLQAGDKIYIPRRPLTVRVGGEVLSPAALQFRKGKAASDYINEAGGTTYYADRDRAFVVYPDGSAKPLSVSAWKHNVTMVPPGSTIIVPRDPKPFDFLESAEKITSILANIALTGFYIDDLSDND